MYIPNEASKSKVKYIPNKPSQNYFDTVQLSYLIDEFAHKMGNETVVKFLEGKLKELK